MIGLSIATVPLRVQLNQSMSLQQYLKAIQEQILALIPHQHYGVQNVKKAGSGAEAACKFRCLVVV